VQFVPTRSIAPDIYVLPGIPQSRVEKVWKLWEEAVVPSLKAARDTEKAVRDALRIEATAREALEAEVKKLRTEAAEAAKPRKPRGR